MYIYSLRGKDQSLNSLKNSNRKAKIEGSSSKILLEANFSFRRSEKKAKVL